MKFLSWLSDILAEVIVFILSLFSKVDHDFEDEFKDEIDAWEKAGIDSFKEFEEKELQ